MKTLLFALLVAVVAVLAFTCGYFRAPYCQRQDLFDPEVRQAFRQRGSPSCEYEMDWHLRIVHALNRGESDRVLVWANLCIDGWIISHYGNPRPEPFPCPTDEPWVISFLAKVARERAEFPVAHDAEVEQPIAEILARALELADRDQ